MASIRPLDFCIFGSGISYTLSPVMHNAAFKALALPHHYSIRDVEELDPASTSAFLASPAFGGGSVTVPHKLAIMPFLDSISLAAKAIGAVNTVLVHDTVAADGSTKRELVGDNTDWIGIKVRAEQQLALLGATTGLSSGLVIGAGGAARAAVYALIQLGVGIIYIYNRTKARAEEIRTEFAPLTTTDIAVVDSLDVTAFPKQDALPLRVIVSNVPGSAFTEGAVPLGLFAGKDGGVLVEMAYKPDVTPMMIAAATGGGEGKGWKVVRGTDVLLEQGFEQFRLWTGIDAPQEVMTDALNEEVKRRALAAK
ncbi:uncharacterized protein V1518DRAFT_423367 [Limtongia smithiae]|uniref:uncharacterized protein n=1 Tax=Limtongia smithiae TaxID=1125753 RepID=UPI0034CD4FE9